MQERFAIYADHHGQERHPFLSVYFCLFHGLFSYSERSSYNILQLLVRGGDFLPLNSTHEIHAKLCCLQRIDKMVKGADLNQTS